VLDTSIGLHRPRDYEMGQGARFEVHIEKARGIHGEAARPFEARLEVVNESAVWTVKEIEDLDRERAEEMFAAGLSLREVAEELGISKTSAHRLRREIAEEAAWPGKG
jgi:putative DNA primase/helicase